MKYTVVIAELNESDLQNTIDNISNTQRNVSEIIVISDTELDGCMNCRHKGIVQAKTDVVIIVDAHMRFKPNSLDILASKTKYNEVNCAKCYHNSKLSFSGNLYKGADFHLKTHENRQYQAISCKWSKGEANAIMGACYCFHKSFYEDMGMPWQIGKGWGGDEEIISALAWFLGGSVNVIDVEVAHLARTQSEVPYKLNRKQINGVWYNRLAIIEILPIPRKIKKEFTNWIYNNHEANLKYMVDENMELLTEIRNKIISNKKMSWVNFKKQIINKEQNMAKAKMKRRAVNMKRKDTLDARLGEPGTKFNQMKNPIVETKPFEVKCPHLNCGKMTNPIITNTYSPKRKRVKCEHCGYPFVIKYTL